MKIKKHNFLILLGIILLSANLRMVITSIPPLLNFIQQSLHISKSIIGILTTIPLICFALLSVIVPPIAKKIGNELSIFVSLIILLIGNSFRIFSSSLMIIGTIFIGIGLTFLNVLLPSLVAEYYPNKTSLLTSIYTLIMTLCSAVSAGISVPLTNILSWQKTILIFSIPIIINIGVWTPILKENSVPQKEIQQKQNEINYNHIVWYKKTAWAMALYAGLESLIFYTLITWLPTIVVSRGLSSDTGGMLLSLFQFFSLPSAYIIPIWAEKSKHQNTIILLIGLGFLIGIGGMLVNTTNIYILACLFIILGLSATGAFSLLMTLFNLKTTNHQQSAAISGMSQSVGYVIAAIGPVTFGYIHNIINAWNPLFILLIMLDIFMILSVIYINHTNKIFQ